MFHLIQHNTLEHVIMFVFAGEKSLKRVHISFIVQTSQQGMILI